MGGVEVGRSQMKYVALREEVGGGEQEEGRRPWHFSF